MFQFRKIRLEDKEWINQCLRTSDFRGGEYSFANNVAWQRLNDTVICHYKNFYISCSFDNGQPYVTFPAGVKTDEQGRKEYIDLFKDLNNFFSEQNKKLIVSSVNEENLQWIKEYYGDNIDISYDRDSSDYIYNTDDLSELKGKKYHGKRNHIKHFMSNDWSFETITSDNINECFEFATQLYNHNENTNDYSSVVEQYAINMFLMNMKYLGLVGAILKSSGKIVGFTIGEQLNSDTFIVHIEKANSDVQGAYPMICNQFIKNFAGDLKYVNREEDLGIEGLRKSKLSYKPVFLLDKYIVTFK